MADLLNLIIPDVAARSDQLWRAFWETLQMVSISGVISLVLGIPFGVLLFTTRKGGILQNRPVNFILSRICDFFRSTPFILLAMVLLSLSRLVVGTAIGVRGAIIPLVFGTIPFLGRQVEGALAEVPAGLPLDCLLWGGGLPIPRANVTYGKRRTHCTHLLSRDLY